MTAALIIDFDQSPEVSDLLSSAVDDAKAAGLSPIIVVGADGPVGDSVWLLEDESSGGEPLSALQAALDLLDRERAADDVVVIDAAHGADPEHIAALIELSAGSPVVVTKYRYARALPVLLDSAVWSAVMALEDSALFGWIDSHPNVVGEEWVASAPRDTPAL
ncbi:MAG: nucleotidyltransferase family protein [Acidimicrobiia bacterium]|nr:nucleotidyltransferase family protein [Acidimicrobiia bacterium]NNC75264.1 NTP transferase domain-containing protein [Acidimicrobiia bacterium]